MQVVEEQSGVVVAPDLVDVIYQAFDELPEGMQSRCHIPPFGMRYLNKDGDIYFEASICWKCNNIFGQLHHEQWSYEFNSQSQPAQTLFQLISSHFPAKNQTESDR